jgi:glucose-6-phosphate 1-epimerase
MADLEGAVLDHSKAVYCRLPMLWSSGTTLPQHGLARNEFWTFDSAVMDNDAGGLTNLCADGFRADDQGVTTALRPNPTNAKLYAKDFRLAYVVTLAEHELSTDIHVSNPSASEALDFQAAAYLHSCRS